MSDQMVEPILANNINHERGSEGSFCDVYRVVRPTAKDIEVVSDQLVETTLMNNKTYESLRCGK